MSYIVTNEVWNINQFWKYSLNMLSTVGCLAFVYGFYSAVKKSQQANDDDIICCKYITNKRYNYIMAFSDAVGTVVDLIDDINFITITN